MKGYELYFFWLECVAVKGVVRIAPEPQTDTHTHTDTHSKKENTFSPFMHVMRSNC